MRNQRRALIALGALLGLALIWGVALAVAHPKHHRKHRRRVCLPYLLIPAIRVCAMNVVYTNPDGSRVMLGTKANFQPMPKPPQERP